MATSLERLRDRLNAHVAKGLLARNNMGYYHPLAVGKRQCLNLLQAVYQILLLVREVEQAEGIAITVEDRFGVPMWLLPNHEI
ncbi:hypothetical protein LCGC14_2641620 [marine sediment metagenome]|uniref:Uncharacterized protein n=1 Tax=marine sediment metagenome TaxID=412755 RepID=A0A0F8ZXH7_9ZZZZ